MSISDRLVNAELARHDWLSVNELCGPASNIPIALRELMTAGTSTDADQAYWKLENHVVVQGEVLDAALLVIHVLNAALIDDTRPVFVRVEIYELLFQILNGYAHSDAQPGLIDKCHHAARNGLWIYYRDFCGKLKNAAKEVIELLDDDNERIRYLENTT